VTTPESKPHTSTSVRPAPRRPRRPLKFMDWPSTVLTLGMVLLLLAFIYAMTKTG
jgi:hypothetical protein